MRQMIIATCALMMSAPALAVPVQFTHQGRLMDSAGNPLEGANTLGFALYDAPAGGTALWTESVTAEFDNGYFSVILGQMVPLDPSKFNAGAVYLSLSVNGGAALPGRQPLTSVPFAFWAQNANTATNVEGGVVNATEIRVNGTTVIDASGATQASWNDLSDVPADFADGTDDGWEPPSCGADQAILYDGSSWTCVDVSDHGHDAADLLSGTVDIARLPVGTSAEDVAAGDHAHNGIEKLSCSAGEIARWDGSAWKCTGAGGGGSLLFAFELDETGGTTFTDSSGGHVAKAPGGGLAAGSAGHSGRGIGFSGGVITVASGNAIGDSPYVTAEAWIEPALPLSGDRVIVMKQGSWKLRQKDATIVFDVTAKEGSCTVTSAALVTAGKWAHVSGVYNGRTIAVSVDDAFVEATCAKGPIAPKQGDPLFIGADASSGSPVNGYKGTVDEVRAWSYAPPSSYFFGSAGSFPGSVLINPEEALLINGWIGDRTQVWERCYQLSAHGRSTSAFHSRCDRRGPSVMVATLSTGKKIGGYASASWESAQTYKYAGGSFLFSLTTRRRYEAPGDNTWVSRTYDHSTYGPTWGGGHDLSTGYSSVIGDGGGDDYCNLGHDYACGSSSYGNTACRDEFCGTYSGWSISEMEVWVRKGW